jgi:hypothetical protein
VLYLLTSAAGGLIGGAFSGVTSTLGGAGSLVGGTVQTAAQAAAPSLSKISNPLDGIEQSVRNQAAGQDPQAAKDAAVAAIRALFTGDPAQKAQAETRAADALAKAQGIPVEQAKAQIQDYRKQYDETVATAKQKAEAAAVAAKSAATQGAFYGALALILGALAGFLGGRLGAPKRHTLADTYDGGPPRPAPAPPFGRYRGRPAPCRGIRGCRSRLVSATGPRCRPSRRRHCRYRSRARAGRHSRPRRNSNRDGHPWYSEYWTPRGRASCGATARRRWCSSAPGRGRTGRGRRSRA